MFRHRSRGPQTAAFDVVVPAHPKDFDVLRHCVRGALRYIEGLRFLHVVAAEPFVADDSRVRWVDERAAKALPDVAQVAALLAPHGDAATARTGWLYQQLMKLGAPGYISDLTSAYMVIDADVIWLRRLPCAVDAGVRFPYTLAYEHHPPYRDAYERLFGAAPKAPFSLTAHQMTYDQVLLSEMKRDIERNHDGSWWQAYIRAMDPREASPISELDIYGFWVLEHHPELALRRQLSYLNVPVIPGPLGRAVYARDYDFVAAHAYMRRPRVERAVQVGAALARDIVAGARNRRSDGAVDR